MAPFILAESNETKVRRMTLIASALEQRHDVSHKPWLCFSQHSSKSPQGGGTVWLIGGMRSSRCVTSSSLREETVLRQQEAIFFFFFFTISKVE